MFVFEGLPDNFHAHSLWRIPKGPAGANRFLRFHSSFRTNRAALERDRVVGNTTSWVAADHSEAMYIMKDR